MYRGWPYLEALRTADKLLSVVCGVKHYSTCPSSETTNKQQALNQERVKLIHHLSVLEIRDSLFFVSHLRRCLRHTRVSFTDVGEPCAVCSSNIHGLLALQIKSKKVESAMNWGLSPESTEQYEGARLTAYGNTA